MNTSGVNRPTTDDEEGSPARAEPGLAAEDAIVNAPAAAAVEPAPFDSVGWVDDPAEHEPDRPAAAG